MLKFKSTKIYSMGGIKVVIYGPAGIGKTWQLRTIVEVYPKTIFVSAEAGGLSVADIDVQSIEINTIEDYIEFYNWARANTKNLECIFIDSLSEIGEKCLAAEKAKGGDGRQAYGRLIDVMTETTKLFRDLKGINVVFTSKMEKSKDDLLGGFLFGPKMPGAKLGQDLPYLLDEIFAMRMIPSEDGSKHRRVIQTSSCPQYTAKDRSGQLDLYEEPHLGNIFKKIETKFANVPAEADDPDAEPATEPVTE